MSLFWENATKLMDAAVSAEATGFATSETMTVLIGEEGGIQLLVDSDWPLERIAEDRSARMAYRVTKKHNRIAVEGVQGVTNCHLETERPERRVKELLRDQPRYFLT